MGKISTEREKLRYVTPALATLLFLSGLAGILHYQKTRRISEVPRARDALSSIIVPTMTLLPPTPTYLPDIPTDLFQDPVETATPVSPEISQNLAHEGIFTELIQKLSQHELPLNQEQGSGSLAQELLFNVDKHLNSEQAVSLNNKQLSGLSRFIVLTSKDKQTSIAIDAAITRQGNTNPDYIMIQWIHYEGEDGQNHTGRVNFYNDSGEPYIAYKSTNVLEQQRREWDEDGGFRYQFPEPYAGLTKEDFISLIRCLKQCPVDEQLTKKWKDTQQATWNNTLEELPKNAPYHPAPTPAPPKIEL